MKERIEQIIGAVSTETPEKVWKNVDFKTNRIMNVSSGHIEGHNIRIRLFETLYDDTG